MSDPILRKAILSLRGKLSYSLIAEALGISRNVVAGIMWRKEWPPRTRFKGTCERGRHGPGVYAARYKKPGPKTRAAA